MNERGSEMDIKVAKKVFIRSAGKDEYWLQNLIYSNPGILGLGELIAVNKEKVQSSGGRLDILLKDPNDNTMYEVEVMLGETDPSHIIRSIEYWDNEKRKYPQRQHYSVLIAESFDRRYFNVIQLLSMNIPMIAIQVDLLDVGGEQVLSFTKIIDVYAEPDDEEAPAIITESGWRDKASWSLDAARELYNALPDKGKTINYTQSYISITIDGVNAYMVGKRSKPTSVCWFKIADDEKAEQIKSLFNDANVDFGYNRGRKFVLNVDQVMIAANRDLFQKINSIKHEIGNDE